MPNYFTNYVVYESDQHVMRNIYFLLSSTGTRLFQHCYDVNEGYIVVWKLKLLK